jgi:hypothetical protein
MTISTYRLADPTGEPIRGAAGLVTVVNGVSFLQGVPVEQAFLDRIQGADIAPSLTLPGHWYSPFSGEDLGTTEQMQAGYARAEASRRTTLGDRILGAAVTAVIVIAGGVGLSGAGAAVDTGAAAVDAGAAVPAGDVTGAVVASGDASVVAPAAVGSTEPIGTLGQLSGYVQTAGQAVGVAGAVQHVISPPVSPRPSSTPIARGPSAAFVLGDPPAPAAAAKPAPVVLGLGAILALLAFA